MNSCTQCVGQMPYHPGSDSFQCECCGTFTPWSKLAKPVDFNTHTLPNRNTKIAAEASSTLSDTAASLNHCMQMPSDIVAMRCLMVATRTILAAIVSSTIMQGGARKKVQAPLGLQD